ncbi:MAG: hypothetical protein HYS17_06805 [Micavibrio aeruginosavorus]|uniref:Uncharacterized protein n=1 Tax=Micavibrio aeruginosavorus TaxID=349221 RepID=A0A7T5UH58_9BACT|nr:MAG: hypothetical protein HYS17_06805 [Micavibrio aeruginosavorus]
MGSDNYLIGLVIGIAIGVGAGAPAGSDIVVDLDRQTAKSIKTGKLSDEQQAKLCAAYEKAVNKYRKKDEAPVSLCPLSKPENTPRPSNL